MNEISAKELIGSLDNRDKYLYGKIIESIDRAKNNILNNNLEGIKKEYLFLSNEVKRIPKSNSLIQDINSDIRSYNDILDFLIDNPGDEEMKSHEIFLRNNIFQKMGGLKNEN